MVAVAVSVLALTGCGGGKKTPAASPTTAAQAVTTPTVGQIGNTSNPFCKAVQAFTDRFSKVIPALTQNNQQQYKSAVTDASAAIKDMQAAAPDSLKADMAQLYDYLQTVYLPLDLSKPDPAVLNQIASASSRYAQATADLNNYLKTNCLTG